MSQTVPSPASPPTGRPPRAELQDRVRSLQLSRIPGGTSYRRTILAVLFGMAVIAVSAWLGYMAWKQGQPGTTGETASAAGKKDSDKAASGAPKEGPPAAAPIAPRSEIALESKGYIMPVHQILVSPEINGRIVELNFVEGTRVEAGFVLARIDDVDYKADFDRAKATVELARAKWDEMKSPFRQEEIDQALAALEEAKAQHKQYEADLKRALELRKSGAVTESELDEFQARLDTNRQRILRLTFAHALMMKEAHPAKVAVAEAEYKQALADLVKAEDRLGKTQVKAPVKGTILIKNAEIGNVVNPIANQGTFSLCEMADLSDLEVELKIQERDISAVFVGQACKVTTEAYPGRVYDGFVSRLMPIADRGQGAVPVRVKVQIPADEEGMYLRPEMGAIVTFLKKPAETVAAAPSP